MERIYVKDLSKKNIGKKILLEGWAHELRDLAKIKFILLRDSTGVIQCILKKDDLFKKFSEFSLESVIRIEGKLKDSNVKSEEVSIHNFEVEITDLELLNKAEPLPIQVLGKGIETGQSKRYDYRSLDLRKQKIKAIFEIQSVIVNSFREFFFKSGFIEIQTPSIIAASTEGGTDLFEIKYFEKKAYLAQSPQLYKQLAAIALEKVFCTTPVWRAEKHNTSRHLNEARQLDIEMAFADEHTVMKQLEQVVLYVIKQVIDKCKSQLKILEVDLKLPKVKYLTYKEVIDTLNKNDLKIKYGDDLEPEAEKKLSEIFPNTIIFYYEWPIELKPFYIWPKDKKVSGGFDALYNGLEISSGGQRVHIPEVLIKQLKDKKLKPEHFKWYIDAFRYGAPKHAGWSIGLERLTMAMLNLENIREAVIWPRDRDRLTP